MVLRIVCQFHTASLMKLRGKSINDETDVVDIPEGKVLGFPVLTGIHLFLPADGVSAKVRFGGVITIHIHPCFLLVGQKLGVLREVDNDPVRGNSHRDCQESFPEL
jgi:hypothetical protein